MSTLELGQSEQPQTTWTPERIEQLKALWAEGVITSEMGRRIGVTKNAVIGKVHRLDLTPRLESKRKPAPRRDVFNFTGPACMWPIGHPGDEDFHFCGGAPYQGKPYCSWHAAKAYISPKDREMQAA